MRTEKRRQHKTNKNKKTQKIEEGQRMGNVEEVGYVKWCIETDDRGLRKILTSQKGRGVSWRQVSITVRTVAPTMLAARITQKSTIPYSGVAVCVSDDDRYSS